MNADNLDVQSVSCFGWRAKNKKECWWYIANDLGTEQWSDDVQLKIAASLASDVDACVQCLMTARFKDVESETEYICKFMNDRMLWNLEIKDSPNAPIPKEDKKNFFASECWKKTCRRAAEIFTRCVKLMDDSITPQLEAGKLLKVDEIKYGKIVDYLHDVTLITNIKKSKYVH